MNQEDLRNKVIEIYKENTNLRSYEIAQKVGCSAKYVKKFLREANFDIERQKRNKTTHFLDSKFTQIKELWEQNLTTREIANRLSISYTCLVKYMCYHSMHSNYKKNTRNMDEKSLDEIYAKDRRYTTRKSTLDDLGLKTVVDGKEYYEVGEFYGIESPRTQPFYPGWKANYHELGIVNFGKEYGEFGCRAVERPMFHAKMFAMRKARGEEV